MSVFIRYISKELLIKLTGLKKLKLHTHMDVFKHTHTHAQTRIYMCVCVWVCMCVCPRVSMCMPFILNINIKKQASNKLTKPDGTLPPY